MNSSKKNPCACLPKRHDGSLKILDRFPFRSQRPDYKKLKKKRNSADNCASILLGFMGPSGIYETTSNFKDEDGWCDVWFYDGDLLELRSIMRDIKEMMEIENMSKDLLATIHPDWMKTSPKNGLVEYADPFEEITKVKQLFPEGIFFETRSFLKVAVEYNFPIPEEMKSWLDEQPDSGNESLSNCSKKPDKQPKETKNAATTNDIDYSLKARSEQAYLAHEWAKSGMTAENIIKRLFKRDYKNGIVKTESLERRLRRLKNDFPQQ